MKVLNGLCLLMFAVVVIAMVLTALAEARGEREPLLVDAAAHDDAFCDMPLRRSGQPPLVNRLPRATGQGWRSNDGGAA